MSIFHRHTWEKANEREQPSPIEILGETGVTKVRGWVADEPTMRPVIVTYHCDGCGADKVVRI